MAIFLHFLNREPYRAANSNYVTADAEKNLRLLAIARADPLYSNFSNLIEGDLLPPSGPPLIKGLLAAEQLLICGERASLAEFIESRVALYAFDSERYPMYFCTRPVAEDIEPEQVRSNSITDHLDAEIRRLAERRASVVEIGVIPSDVSQLNESLSVLHNIICERESRAITKSLFSGKLGGKQKENAAARLISTIYIKKYQDELDCDIASRVRGIGCF